MLILSHATTIKTRYQAMLHVGPIQQTCAIIDIDRELIRAGDRAMVAFRFVQRPEYLVPGDRLLFREGRTKGLGIVTSVGYDPSKPLRKAQESTSEGGDEDGGGEGEKQHKDHGQDHQHQQQKHEHKQEKHQQKQEKHQQKGKQKQRRQDASRQVEVAA